MKCSYCGKEDSKYILKNGNVCCEKTYNSCQASRKKMCEAKKKSYKWTVNANSIKISCKYCNKDIALTGIKKHERHCFNNPENIKYCVLCGKQLLQHQLRDKNTTCSWSCSNTYFKELRNKPENYKNHRTICFYNHVKKCIICGEENIVSVHHYDRNHENNNKDNLIPLCPTHHQYIHSSYYDLIKDKVEKYHSDIITMMA